MEGQTEEDGQMNEMMWKNGVTLICTHSAWRWHTGRNGVRWLNVIRSATTGMEPIWTYDEVEANDRKQLRT